MIVKYIKYSDPRSSGLFPKFTDEGWNATSWLFDSVRNCWPPPLLLDSIVKIFGYSPAQSAAFSNAMLSAVFLSYSGGTITKRTRPREYRDLGKS